MPCYGPLTAWFAKDVNPETGRRSLVFDKRKSHSGVPIQIPCGQCIGCRLERARQWAVRCMQEKRMHPESAFVTLTYDQDNCPSDYSLKKRDLQLFMKRLRKTRPAGLRFFACGEYGERTLRPHYHVLLFNTSFPDQKFHKNAGDSKLYASAELDGLWMNGNCLIGDVTFESCSYVARYVLKKMTGEPHDVEAHYRGREPEFCTMSNRPGIGFPYYEKYGEDAYRHDAVVINGKSVGIPRYYDKKYEAVDPGYLERLKIERRRRAKLRKVDATTYRRRAIEAFQIAKQRFFKRGSQ